MEPEIVAISKFKATCLELLKRVNHTGQSLLITRNGEVIAMVTPPPPPPRATSWMGAFAQSGRIVGDIIAPAADPEDWDVLSR